MKYPDPITCFDPTCMQDCVWGEVCISWSSTVVVIVSDSYVHDLLWFLPFRCYLTRDKEKSFAIIIT